MNMRNTNVITNLLDRAIMRDDMLLALLLRMANQSKFFTVSGGTLRVCMSPAAHSMSFSEYSV